MIYFFAGMLAATVMGGIAAVAYRRTLLACAQNGTPERLDDGKFYYLVEESRYSELWLAHRDWERLQDHIDGSKARNSVTAEAILAEAHPPQETRA